MYVGKKLAKKNSLYAEAATTTSPRRSVPFYFFLLYTTKQKQKHVSCSEYVVTGLSGVVYVGKKLAKKNSLYPGPIKEEPNAVSGYRGNFNKP